jgi:ferric-dicitrate binding protein FerR (iron transport regulator)
VIDGQNDYSAYTREQLFDALKHIDRTRYPLNLANLERALAKLDAQHTQELPPLEHSARSASVPARRWRPGRRMIALLVALALAIAGGVGWLFVKKMRAAAQVTQATVEVSCPSAETVAT